MTAHLTLTADTIRPILTALQALAGEAEARRVALLHDSGLVLADAGEDAHQDQGESGALAAGAFFAARLFASRLGEPAFTGLHYEGAQRDFLLTTAGPETLVLVVFDDRTRPAIVRACLAKHLPAIEVAAARLRAQAPSATPPLPRLPQEAAFRESSANRPDPADVFHS